jgi:pimeloyl-ACP methyl ester carboxylesterase
MMAREDRGIVYEAGRIPTDEGHLSYFTRGGPGPDLILIPGSFNDRRAFGDVIPNLDREIRTIIVENRGHGGSWPPPRDGSIEKFARDVLCVADKASTSRFFVGGHSIGGMTALEVGRVAPERVIGVISIEGWTNAGAAKMAFGDLPVGTMPQEVAERRSALRASVIENWSEEQKKSFASIWRRWDGTDFLETTSLPVLEIWGDRGRPRPDIERLLIPRRDNIEVMWIENASHSLPLEAPRQVADAINGFIRRIGEGRAGGSQ